MSRVIDGDGPTPCDVMFVGERPGYEEAIEGVPFVGPAGQELWKRVWRTCQLSRDDMYTTNLVKTFSKEPPSTAEVRTWAPFLLAELYKVRPAIIVTIGYHAARYFLPQFAAVNGDYFHGLVYPYQYGRLNPRSAIVIPVVHASAALRQPDRYQYQLSTDLATVATVLRAQSDGLDLRSMVHRTIRPRICEAGLAAFLKEDQEFGLDTEYSDTETQAVTLASGAIWLTAHEAACVELEHNECKKFLGAALRGARSLIAHMAKAEYHACRRIGVDLTDRRVDDTMLMAYLLQLPQSLKVLAYRELGWEMDAYTELIGELDQTQVQSQLEEAFRVFTRTYAQHEETLQATAIRYRRHRIRAPRAKALAQARHGKEPTIVVEGEKVFIPRRALTSLRRIVGASSDQAESLGASSAEGGESGSDGEAEHGARQSDDDRPAESPRESLRRRWRKSTFARLVPLRPAPTWRDLPASVRRTYAMTDAVAARALKQRLWPQLVERRLRQVYEIDRAVLPFLVRNEQIGLAVDADGLRALSIQFKAEREAIQTQIDDLAGRHVNPNAGADVSECLFMELGIRRTRLTKGGSHYTTQDKYLKARKGDHAIIPLILDARQLTKYIGTYTDKLPLLLINGRYHPDWKYTRTATGRLAEEIILLIPKHSKRAKTIRNCFHATAGHLLVSVDLSQIELRAMAHLSGDRKLLRAFARGEDFHANVARDLLGAPARKEDQDESLHRLPAKTINFGIINGMTEYGMLDQLHENGQLQWTIEDVKRLLDEWFVIHHGVKEYWQTQKSIAKRQGYVTDLFGRRRYIPAMHSTDPRIVAEAERQCLCAIQATADGISKIWNKKIWRDVIRPRTARGIYCEPWIRVHDDTTVECDRREAKVVAAEMLARVPQLLSVPTLAEAKHGERWGELHA